MSDELSLDQVDDARADKEYTVVVPIQFGTNGTREKKDIEIVYRPLTPEVLAMPGWAAQLSALIVRWPFKEEPTFETLNKRPIPFLEQIGEAIKSDFFQERPK